VSQLVVLNLGNGDGQKGFATVTAQLWVQGSTTPMQFTGWLPPAPNLALLLNQWRTLYLALSTRRGWRRSPPTPERESQVESGFEIEQDDAFVADISLSAFQSICHELEQQFNQWLNADGFRAIDRQLRTHLSRTEELRLIITTGDRPTLQLPWHLWHLLADYPQAELALSLPSYRQSLKKTTPNPTHQVRILIILGDSQGIDIEIDQQLFEQLPNAQLTCLVEPTSEQIHHQLWQPGWDILFFAGHSSSQGAGTISINPSQQLTLEQLKFALKTAIARGLQLAIFNSCDGLGLAWDLADLQIPQVIVMREPIPDRVAHDFLKYFLASFSTGQSFYLAVREARERLQALEDTYLCATWLPVICQNPAETPPTWEGMRGLVVEGRGHRVDRPNDRVEDRAALVPQLQLRSPSPEVPASCGSKILNPKTQPNPATVKARGPAALLPTLLTSLLVTGLVVGARSLGWLQPMELWGFDRFMALRPTESPDPRLVILSIDEADMQAQNTANQRGSISDQTLDRVLQILERAQPRAIGLDIYRDFPVSSQTPSLKTRLQTTKRLVAICKGRDPQFDPAGVAPPPELPESQLGFSDFLPDGDGRVRRQLLTQFPDPASPCTTPYAFSTRLAFRYLEVENIRPSFQANGNLQLGQAEFQRLDGRFGGYQSIDARGNQVMLNVRALPVMHKIAPHVSLSQLLQGKVNPASLRDRLVLIGVTANSSSDLWPVSFGGGLTGNVPGVIIQAHMTSQLISTVLDRRPLIWAWPWFGDAAWIWGWALVAGVSVGGLRSRLHKLLAMGLGIGILTTACLLLLTRGGWVPWIPASLSFVVTSAVLIISRTQLSD
jgi:CHASE2 domain-containing sensor protein